MKTPEKKLRTLPGVQPYLRFVYDVTPTNNMLLFLLANHVQFHSIYYLLVELLQWPEVLCMMITRYKGFR